MISRKRKSNSLHDLLHELKDGKIRPVYLIHGEESFLADRALNTIKEKVLVAGTRDFNFDQLYADAADAGKIVDIARAYPMMAERRLLIVKDISRLSADGLALLRKYIEDPNQTTCLVLTVDRIDGRKKFYENIGQLAYLVDCAALYDSQIPQWIRDYVASRGREIRADAIKELNRYVGSSLYALANEIEKLEINLPDKPMIELEDIHSVVGAQRKFNVFDLADALGQRELVLALEIGSNLLSTGTMLPPIISALHGHFVSMLKIKLLQATNVPPREIRERVRLPFYFFEDRLKHSARFSVPELQGVFEALLEADIQAKSGNRKNHAILYELIYKIVRQSALQGAARAQA